LSQAKVTVCEAPMALKASTGETLTRQVPAVGVAVGVGRVTVPVGVGVGLGVGVGVVLGGRVGVGVGVGRMEGGTQDPGVTCSTSCALACVEGSTGACTCPRPTLPAGSGTAAAAGAWPVPDQDSAKTSRNVSGTTPQRGKTNVWRPRSYAPVPELGRL